MSILTQIIDYTRGPHKIAMRATGCRPLEVHVRYCTYYGYNMHTHTEYRLFFVFVTIVCIKK